MEKEPQQAAVFYHDKKAGILSKKGASYEFVYDPAYLENSDAKAISLSLPLRPEKYVSSRLFFNKLFKAKRRLLDLCNASPLAKPLRQKLIGVLESRYLTIVGPLK
jgi:HipA-like protein